MQLSLQNLLIKVEGSSDFEYILLRNYVSQFGTNGQQHRSAELYFYNLT